MNNFEGSLHARDVANVLHGYTNLRRHEERGPTVIVRGEGVYVYDARGRRYLDGLAALWNAALGFGEERLAEAAARQMRTLGCYHNFSHMHHEPGVELAEKLIEVMPVPMSKVFFTCSGSEANDTQVKLAWYLNNALDRPDKKRIIARESSYHGVTIAAASLSGLTNLHRNFDVPIDRVLHTSFASHFHGAEAGEDEEAYASRLADELEELIVDTGPETVAAFIAEPVVGGGGLFVPPRTYFEKIQAVLAKYDVLFIADEVICGFGRTGNWFGCETVDARPDSMSIAKNLTAGHAPLAATVISEPMYEALRIGSDRMGAFSHGFTFGGHPVSCAVALEAIAIYEERDVVGHVRRVGPRLMRGLREKFGDHPLVGDIRGVGLLVGMELVADRASRRWFDPSDRVGLHLAECALEHGLIVRCVAGTDIVTIAPPLIISEQEIDELVDILGRAMVETEAMVAHRKLARIA